MLKRIAKPTNQTTTTTPALVANHKRAPISTILATTTRAVKLDTAVHVLRSHLTDRLAEVVRNNANRTARLASLFWIR